MSEAPSQPQTERTQHRLRVTAIDRKLDSAFANLTDPKILEQHKLPPFLYLFSTKAFSRQFASLRQRTEFERYNTRLLLDTDVKHDTYETEPGINVLRNDGQVKAIGLRIRLGTKAALSVIAPPFYDSKFSSTKLLPVRYKIPYPADDIEDRLEVLRRVVADGATLDELVMVNEETQHLPVLIRPIPARVALHEAGIELPEPREIVRLSPRTPESKTNPSSQHAS